MKRTVFFVLIFVFSHFLANQSYAETGEKNYNKVPERITSLENNLENFQKMLEEQNRYQKLNFELMKKDFELIKKDLYYMNKDIYSIRATSDLTEKELNSLRLQVTKIDGRLDAIFYIVGGIFVGIILLIIPQYILPWARGKANEYQRKKKNQEQPEQQEKKLL